MTTSQHLVFIIHNLKGGGAEKVFTGLVEHFSTLAQVTVITFEPGGIYETRLAKNPNIHLLSLDPKAGALQRVLHLRQHLLRIRPHKVISFLEYPNILTSWALIGTGIPHISSERIHYIEYLGNSLKAKLKIHLLKGVFARAQKVVVVSEGIRNSLIQDFQAQPGKVVTIPNGIEAEGLKQKSTEPITVEPVPDRNTILAVGRLAKQKNYPLLIEAFRIARQTNSKLRLCIAGDGPLREDLIQLAREKGIQDAVTFAGFVANPAPLMLAAGCYVLSSDQEGMPNALLEAYFLNGHVISTDCKTGPSEIITHGEDGWLIPTGDTNALAAAIVEVMQNETTRNKLLTGSRQNLHRFEQQAIWKRWEREVLS